MADYAFVISLAQKSDWDKYVSKALQYDFYHTWDYQNIAKNGEPILFVYEEEDDFVAFPLLKRQIPNTNYCDFHAVYGYPGPISNKKFENLDSQFLLNFQEQLLQFLKDQNCVSVFSKFHPFINQTLAVEKLGGVHYNGKTVVIDLTIPLEEQRNKYRTSSYKDIIKARDLGFTVREMERPEDITLFTKLYQDSMTRVRATDFYMFDEAYFTELLKSEQCKAKLLMVFFEGKLICGSITTQTQDVLQAHLLATDKNYLKYSPAKFIIDEICLMGRANGKKYFNLGGGVGFKDNSLLNWKLGFSDVVLPHNSWRFVVNKQVYRHLVEQAGHDINDTVDFFPLYRLLKTET